MMGFLLSFGLILLFGAAVLTYVWIFAARRDSCANPPTTAALSPSAAPRCKISRRLSFPLRASRKSR